ncbi:MAG TPA: aldo/keto reductase [Candidatus Binataceae bacterium]|jgi:aryl-alcohol dehydrogenase-like predicted oxidoreductase|nr:aldo/keto reductase [Candidatus Binataceae bacterium]
MDLPQSSRLQLAPDLNICRILNGMWQVSGAHGAIDPERAVESMFDYVDAGFTTFDLADHYGPAEEFIGEFRRRLEKRRGGDALSGVQAFTKWVPPPSAMTRAGVEAAIDRSLRRMNVDALDLLQFHWWDYGDDRYLDALGHMADLQREGKIKHLALTNFDTEHLGTIVENGIRIVSNQVQYSLIDRRPQIKMAPFCRDHGVQLLAYGTVCGGLLSAPFLGAPDPRRAQLDTASLQKYKRMIDAWGGWDLFQKLLATLDETARKHGISIANVATRYILDQPAVAGVILGVRLGRSAHIEDNARAFGLHLDADDVSRIEAVLANSRDLFAAIGDCGDEYR